MKKISILYLEQEITLILHYFHAIRILIGNFSVETIITVSLRIGSTTGHPLATPGATQNKIRSCTRD